MNLATPKHLITRNDAFVAALAAERAGLEPLPPPIIIDDDDAEEMKPRSDTGQFLPTTKEIKAAKKAAKEAIAREQRAAEQAERAERIKQAKLVAAEVAMRKAKEKAESLNHVKIRDVMKIVAERYGMPERGLLSHRRAVSLPKQIALYLCRELSTKSSPDIGRMFGLDHTTVLHGARKISKMVEADAAFAAEIADLKIMIDPSLAPGDPNQMALPFEVAAE